MGTQKAVRKDRCPGQVSSTGELAARQHSASEEQKKFAERR